MSVPRPGGQAVGGAVAGGREPAPGRGRKGRAALAVVAALLVAFDVACLSVLGFLVVGQTLGYLALIGWTHVMAIVGVANAVLFAVVLWGLLHRWRRGHRRGHMVEIALVTTVAGVGAVVLGHAAVIGVQMAFVAVSDPSAWDLETLLPSLLDWL
ncbi:MAG: hypothetical protein ACRYG6_15960 [Janthinobacterium lividum]